MICVKFEDVVGMGRATASRGRRPGLVLLDLLVDAPAGLSTLLWERRPRRDQPRCHSPSARGRASYNRHPHRRPDKPAAGAVHPAGLDLPGFGGCACGLSTLLWERRPRRDQPRCHNSSARGRASYNRHPHRRPDKPAAGPVHPAGLVDAPTGFSTRQRFHPTTAALMGLPSATLPGACR